MTDKYQRLRDALEIGKFDFDLEDVIWGGDPSEPPDFSEQRLAADDIQALLAERDALKEFARAVVRYAGNAGDDYLADKARTALAMGETK